MRQLQDTGLVARKVLKLAAIAVLCIVIGAPALIIGLLFGVPAFQDATYARFAFGPFRGVERVVASKRETGFGGGCTFAVVELTPIRSAELLAGNEFRDVFGQQEAFREKPSEINPTPDNAIPAGYFCYFEGMADSDRKAIEDGLREPGGWVSTSHNYLLFFLPKRNLIGTMHFHGY